MTQKELRAAAREFLSKYLKVDSYDHEQARIAIQVLNAPEREGE